MTVQPSDRAWILYSPIAPGRTDDELAAQASVVPSDAEYASSEWHQDGFFLPVADFEGWRFGLLQNALHPSGLQAFVRSPAGDEATLVSDPHAPRLERLPVPAAPGYVGAFRLALPSLISLLDIVEGFRSVLPFLKAEFPPVADWANEA